VSERWASIVVGSLAHRKAQQEYVKDEQKNLKRELLHAQEEVKRIQSVRADQ
jgi:hypothetical protein